MEGTARKKLQIEKPGMIYHPDKSKKQPDIDRGKGHTMSILEHSQH